MTTVNTPQSKPRLLIVDPETAVLDALSGELHHLNADIHTFTDSKQALEALPAISPQVVISDVRMPQVDGIAVMETVAQKFPRSERILLTSQADLQNCIEAIHRGKVHYFLEKPWDSEALKRIIENGIELADLRLKNVELTALTLKQRHQLECWNLDLDNMVQERAEELREAYMATVGSFAELAEQRMQGRQSNARHVAKLARAIAERMCVDSREEVTALRDAALLRNIGKVSFSDELLATPYFDMNSKQRRAYQEHPTLSALVVGGSKPLRRAARILARYCENPDGSGFPKGRKLEDIPLSARILRVASDYYDGIDGHLFSSNHSEADVLEWIKQHAGSHYEAEIVDILLDMLEALARRMENSSATETSVTCKALQPGMRLSRDLVLSNGLLLLSAGTELDETLIEQIGNLAENREESLTLYVGGNRVEL